MKRMLMFKPFWNRFSTRFTARFLTHKKPLIWFFASALLLFVLPEIALSQGLPMFSSAPSGGGQTYTLSVQTLLTITALSFIPATLLMTTSFTRIIIVLSLLEEL